MLIIPQSQREALKSAEQNSEIFDIFQCASEHALCFCAMMYKNNIDNNIMSYFHVLCVYFGGGGGYWGIEAKWECRK